MDSSLAYESKDISNKLSDAAYAIGTTVERGKITGRMAL